MDTFRKQPLEVLDYDADFSEWMPASDEISTKAVSVSTGLPYSATTPLVIDSSSLSVSTDVVKVWLSAGLTGTRYKVTVRVVTTGGRTKELEFKVQVRDT